jgi:hypothetical protein
MSAARMAPLSAQEEQDKWLAGASSARANRRASPIWRDPNASFLAPRDLPTSADARPGECPS